MNAMLSSVNDFWTIIPACRRATSDFNPITGTYFKPPSKDDGYVDVDYDGREMYAQQAQNLWDRSNTFGQKLSKFANGASVVDQEDCAFELDQVVSLIETGCKEPNGAGMKMVTKTNQI